MVRSRSLKRALMLMLGLILASLATATHPTMAADGESAFTLAVLRRDGTLMPFAVYDGRRWRNPWPVPAATADMPITLADIPKGWWHDKRPLMDWTLFPTSGASRTLHVNGLTAFPAQCQQGVGLRTDYKPAILPPPPRVHPYPKDGLAVAGTVQISPIEMVGPTDKTAISLAALLPDAIAPKEEEIVRKYMMGDVGWTHSYTSTERERVHVDLEALYRVPRSLDGRDVYYFEAVKRYFLPKSAGTQERSCDLVTFASGWFAMTAAGKIGELIPHVRVVSCDYGNASFMLPLGAITQDGKSLWIVQWSNSRHESYEIVAPNLKEERMLPVFEASGGFCEVP